MGVEGTEDGLAWLRGAVTPHGGLGLQHKLEGEVEKKQGLNLARQ